MQRITKKTGIYLAVGIMATMGMSHKAEALPGITGAQADAISATITKTLAGQTPITTTIAPVVLSSAGYPYDESKLNDDQSAGSASQTVYGVEVYNFLDVDDSTFGANGTNIATAEEKSGISSLLGGLVKWNSNENPATCSINADAEPSSFSCGATETIQGLTVNNVAVPLASYPAGTSIPVNGTISDPQCSTGTENFSGYLILQESQYVIPDGFTLTVRLTGMHLVGQATCTAPSLPPLFTTTYDIRVAESKTYLGAHFGPFPFVLFMNFKANLQ